MSEIRAVPLISERGDTFVDCDHVVDGASNHFVGYVEQAGNDTWATIKRYAPNGAVTGEWTVLPSVNHKIDELTLAHSGDALLVLLTTHEIVSQKPRSIRVESAAIPGVYSVRAGMELEEGGAGAFTGGGEPESEPQEGGMTIEELTEALTNPDHPLTVTLGKLIRNRGREAMGIEITNRRVVTEEMFTTKPPWEGGQSSPIIYEQLKNTSHAGTMTALAAFGVCKDT